MAKHQPLTAAEADRCQMFKPHHPDCECSLCKAYEDERCSGAAIGTTEDGVRVCAECAKQMEREGFAVTVNADDAGKEQPT